ncbi:MAG TPA: stage II sporulation protein R [Firmicutes bacterium]|jgi:stage II sporulation protein R|nr:stage II sporulation protein R [Bacillota bacterium]
MSFKYRVLTSGLILLFFMTIGALGSGMAWMENSIMEAYNRSNLIRLHVVANSDSVHDQTIKLRVRDRLIQVSEPLLIKVEEPARAEEILAEHIDLLKQTAEQVLASEDQNMPVTVTLGKYQFPERSYPFGVLPAGEYRGLRVVLGKGAGKNWWCVLYPPLCLLDKDAPSFKGVAPPGNIKVEYHLAALENLVHKKGLSMDEFWKGWGKFFGLI